MADPTLTEVLLRLDRALAELLEVRAALVPHLTPAPTAGGNGLDVDSDFAPQNLVELSTAVELFNRPADSLRWLCRKQACGVKIAGRWMASPARLERRLKRE